MKRLPLILIVAFLFIKTPTWCQTIHVVISADTENKQEEFAASCRADYRKMKKEFETMAKQVSYGLEFYEAVGQKFTPSGLEDALSRINSQTDDIIFVFFAGKGACDPAISPEERILQMGAHGTDISSTERISILLETKESQLNVIIVDACASIWDSGIVSSRAGAAQHVYQTLLSAKGTIKILSSSCTELSWGDEEGGYFTNAFLASIEHYISTPALDITWESLILTSADITNQRAMAKFRVQNPVFFFSDDFADTCDP